MESLTGHGARGKAYIVLESYRIRTGEEPGSIFVPRRAVPILHGTGRETRLAGSCLSLFLSLSLSLSLSVCRFFTFSSFPFLSFLLFSLYVLYSNAGNSWHGVPRTRRKACRELTARRKCSVKIGGAVAIVPRLKGAIKGDG